MVVPQVDVHLRPLMCCKEELRARPFIIAAFGWFAKSAMSMMKLCGGFLFGWAEGRPCGRMPGGVGDPRLTDWTIAVGAGAMVRDPDFGDIDEMKAVSGRRRHGFGRWVVYSLIALSGLHMVGTGSPIPLWHIERLDHPVGVAAIGDEALELKDGRTVRLPFIKRLPRTDPLLAKAVSRGVEVGQGGVVYGLVEPTRLWAMTLSSITECESI